MNTTALQTLQGRWPSLLTKNVELSNSNLTLAATGFGLSADLDTLYTADPTDAVSIQNFASDNNMEYRPALAGVADSERYMPSWIVGAQTQAKLWLHEVSGSIEGYPISMFVDYRVSSSTQKGGVSSSLGLTKLGVVNVELNKIFPQLVLDSSKNDQHHMSSAMVNYKLSQIVKLEGNFNETFDFYAPPGLEAEALSVLAPNFMQILQDSSGAFDVEIFGSNLYLLTTDPLYTPTVIENAMAALTEQLTYLRRLETSWSYTPQTAPFDLLQTEAVSSKVVKVGRLRFKMLYAVLIVFLAVCLLLMFLPRHSVTL